MELTRKHVASLCLVMNTKNQLSETATHTPGPWVYAKSTDGAFAIWDSLNRLVAKTNRVDAVDTRPGAPTHPDAIEANARLIVSAVNSHAELLAAFQQIIDGCRREGSLNSWVADIARAAIAKAHGRGERMSIEITCPNCGEEHDMRRSCPKCTVEIQMRALNDPAKTWRELGFLAFEKYGEKFAVTRNTGATGLAWRVTHVETGAALPNVEGGNQYTAQQRGIDALKLVGEEKVKAGVQKIRDLIAVTSKGGK